MAPKPRRTSSSALLTVITLLIFTASDFQNSSINNIRHMNLPLQAMVGIHALWQRLYHLN
jgi:hypothetical protein